MFKLFSRLRAGLPRLAAIALLACGASAFADDARFDPVANQVTIPSVKVGGATYVNVTLTHLGNYVFQLAGATPGVAVGAISGTYDLSTNVLLLPVVRLGNATYRVQMVNTGNFTFQLTSAAAVETFLYYSRTAPGLVQTATVANGSLMLDNVTISNFRFGESGDDSSQTLQAWIAPWNVISNQPAVPAMLWCGIDGKLSYVILKEAAEDPTRVTASASSLVDAIAAAPAKTGVGVYSDCNTNQPAQSWVNNLPSDTFLLSPDLFHTYTRAQVLSRLNTSVIYQQPGTPSNQHNFLGLTWSGGNAFEAWH